jgi:hypothetical protein
MSQFFLVIVLFVMILFVTSNGHILNLSLYFEFKLTVAQIANRGWPSSVEVCVGE